MARDDPKFASQINGRWQAHDFGNVYAVEKTTRPDRLCIAASRDGSKLLHALSRALKEPFLFLYVLVIFRGGGIEGRYQSGELTPEELDAMFSRYGPFWDSDGRHSIWLRSEEDNATLAYDRHNLIYAYGPLQRFESVLNSLGYTKTAILSLAFEHQHSYHAEFDVLERELTTKFADRRSDLRPGDENPC